MHTKNTPPPFTIYDLLADADSHRYKTADWSDGPIAITKTQEIVVCTMDMLLTSIDYRGQQASTEAQVARILALLYLQLDDYFPTEEVTR